MFNYTIVVLLCTLFMTCLPANARSEQWITYPGASNEADSSLAGSGKSIVFISGDEEYRSEEALPMLARILSERHGFACHVLFAIDPETGAIDPDVRDNIPGLHLLDDADLMVIATRFRDLPDEQMAAIDRYVESGRPIVGLRTVTHAFAISSEKTYARYSWDAQAEPWAGGFGRAILGETWIAHHGAHGSESTRGIIPEEAADHAVNRGIRSGDVWGPTDVYAVRLPLPAGCEAVMLGEVVGGMSAGDAAVEGAKNEPMMPIAWTRMFADSPRRVFTTTMGAATDFVAEATRRMVVQGVFWALGMEDDIPPGGCDVRLVGPYTPTAFGFGGFRAGVRPADHAMKAHAAKRSGRPDLARDATILVTGNTYAERLAQSGLFDLVMHAAYPDHALTIRHVPWSGDTVAMRRREHSVPRMLDWVDRHAPDVIVLAYGMAESFDESSCATFEDDLKALIWRLQSREEPPQVILFSPMAHEAGLHPDLDEADIASHNETLGSLTTAMQRAGAATGSWFVDMFTPTLAYRDLRQPLTTNGVHPNERGVAFTLGAMIDALELGASGERVDGERVAAARALACDKHFLERLRYRPTNTEYVWGRRREPFGAVNFPPEMAQLDRMIAAREAALRAMSLDSPVGIVAWAMAAEEQWPLTPSERRFAEDDWTPEAVEAKGTETSLGSLEIAPPDEFVKSFTVPDGYAIECFASEETTPELANPLAMAFDDRHRLWVLCAPTYPHLLPGQRGQCRLIVLEDTDGDGVADTTTVFADGLMIPTGFAIDTDGVYLGHAPDLLFLRDTDGDGKADRTEIVASGFGMCDSHHQISAFEWDPAGGFVMHEGVFTVSNVETARGVVRTQGAGVWRFDPRTGDMMILGHCYFNNPWGHVFDDFGAGVIADASDGANYATSHVALPFNGFHKPRKPAAILNRGRPTAGCEIISSRHFPDAVQGAFLVNQSIGFHGTRWNMLTPAGSSFEVSGISESGNLVECSDTNFRPVAMEIGPDGALYIADWCNPIIGHMQYSVRDPRRDHSHGRIWRVRHTERPLVEPPRIHDASIAELLEMLRLPERNTRQLARRRLQKVDWATLAPILTKWRTAIATDDPLRWRLVLEDLWIRHAQGVAGMSDIERVLALRDGRARAGAMRVMRLLLQSRLTPASESMALLTRSMNDESMEVRIEAVLAASFLPPDDAIAIIARADDHDMDAAMRLVFEEVIATLGERSSLQSDVLERVRLARLSAGELLSSEMNDLVAGVMLNRVDVDQAHRARALAHLAGDDPDDQADVLVGALSRTHDAGSIGALGELMLSLPDDTLIALVPIADSLRDGPNQSKHALGCAMALRAGKDLDARAIVDGSWWLPAGSLSVEQIDAVRRAVESGDVEPNAGVSCVATHATNDQDVQAWLEELARDGSDRPLDQWDRHHLVGMAALRVLNTLPSSPNDAIRIAPASREQLERGRLVYQNEEIGCIRCHGSDGTGLEGFPPLAASPWVVGNARRAAAVVTHGLFGALRMPNGSTFNSVMEPLGESLSDEQIADVLTFVRQSFGNYAPVVAVADVAEARAAGTSIWEVQSLLSRYPLHNDTISGRPLVATGYARGADNPGAFMQLAWFVLVYILPPVIVTALILWRLERGG